MKVRTKENKFWKVEIMGIPATATARMSLRTLPESDAEMYGFYIDELGLDAIVEVPVEGWAPDGWLADPQDRAAWVERYGDARFFWPSTNRLYQTKGSARARARLIESYGAVTRIVESDPLVWLTPTILREREIQQLKARLDELGSDVSIQSH